jgi:protocatechuate 3,4-dioxygenase, beta subunit
MRDLSRRVVIPVLCGLCICRGEENPAWRARVADEKEPGDRLVIRGRVLRTPGGPAAAGASIMVYQTDAGGIYSTMSGRPIDVARLRGSFRTGPNGEYEIVTIRPGRYPGGGAPAHIHVNVVEDGKPPREIFEFFFAGDPLLPRDAKGYVLHARKDAQGRWTAVQDVALSK